MQAMGTPLLAGRLFTPADNENSQLVTIVNHKFAEHYWPGSERHRQAPAPWHARRSQTPWVTIVGEVADVKEDSPDLPDKEQYYQPVEQFEKSLGSLGSPTTSKWQRRLHRLTHRAWSPSRWEMCLRATVRSIDSQLALDQVQSMQHTVSDSEAPRRFNTALISAFALPRCCWRRLASTV